MSLDERRRRGLLSQRALLLDELAAWRVRAQGGPLTFDYGQVSRLTTQLEALLRTTTAALGPAPDGPSLGAAELELRIAGVHKIWNHFRSALVLREDPWFSTWLATADDLARHTYLWTVAEAEQRGLVKSGDLKEPPLVVLTGEQRSEFLNPRNGSFLPHGITTTEIARFRSLLARLPVPVVGVPWFRANQIASLLFIAHEVGHAVAHDLHLEADIHEALESGLGEAQAETWIPWAAELFADLFALLTCGPAYLDALMSVLLDTTQSSARHPPARERFWFGLAVLHRADWPERALDSLRASWSERCPPPDDAKPSEGAARALLERAYGRSAARPATIRELVPRLAPDSLEYTRDCLTAPRVLGSYDPCLRAAAVYLAEHPEGWPNARHVGEHRPGAEPFACVACALCVGRDQKLLKRAAPDAANLGRDDLAGQALASELERLLEEEEEGQKP